MADIRQEGQCSGIDFFAKPAPVFGMHEHRLGNVGAVAVLDGGCGGFSGAFSFSRQAGLTKGKYKRRNCIMNIRAGAPRRLSVGVEAAGCVPVGIIKRIIPSAVVVRLAFTGI